MSLVQQSGAHTEGSSEETSTEKSARVDLDGATAEYLEVYTVSSVKDCDLVWTLHLEHNIHCTAYEYGASLSEYQ